MKHSGAHGAKKPEVGTSGPEMTGGHRGKTTNPLEPGAGDKSRLSVDSAGEHNCLKLLSKVGGRNIRSSTVRGLPRGEPKSLRENGVDGWRRRNNKT